MATPLRHVAIEGAIGVGKTTLTHRLAAALGGAVMLEEPAENPFLARFYSDPSAWAYRHSCRSCFSAFGRHAT